MEIEASTDELSEVRAYFIHWIEAHGSQGAVGQVAQWLTSENLDPCGLRQIARAHGAGRDKWFRGGVVDLFLGFVSSRTEARALTRNDLVTARVLSRLLHIHGTELVALRSREVATLVAREVDSAIHAGRVTPEDDAYLVELQAVFDLSYDDYLNFARPALERAVAVRHGSTARDAGSGAEPRDCTPNALEMLQWLAERQPRSLGRLM